MGFICLECFKKKNPNSEDCIDNFYDKEELQDLFTETQYNLIERVMHLEVICD